MVDEELKEARERLKTAYDAQTAATVTANIALAEVVRLEIVKLAEEEPSLTTVTFSLYDEYNDEGSYDEVVRIRGTFEGEDADDRGDDLYDIGMGANSGAGHLLCDGLWDEPIPIQKLKDARF